MRNITRALITAGAAVFVMSGTATTASAAASPTDACGPGFFVQESQELGWYQGTGGPQATVHLLYNASTGENCAVTVVTGGRNQGTVGAGLRIEGDEDFTRDEGDYNAYAGPVKLRANGKCVQYYGSTQYWSRTVMYDEYISPFGHCG
ncbi:spore-associated protein A [Streptomyces sp. NPDC048424]|uniref:spore-associated protein A n=1 Tax=Streptomyces sp. NPDC048424 TaxID=3155265 RepID=UPI00342A08A9